MGHPDAGQRNLLAVAAATFIGFAGFTLVMPFLPLYFRQLGVADDGAVALWAGLSLGATPAITAVLAPVWGRVADRYGRKLMIERSLASFVIVMSAMAYVTAAWQVFALRVVQGLFAGYGPLALAMAAESAPPGRMAGAIGTVQTAQRLGPALGPVIGGAVAQVVGVRRAFLVAAAFYALAFLLVLILYREPTRDAAVERPGDLARRAGLRALAGLQGVPLLLAAIFWVQFADRSVGPVLPLYLERLGVGPDRVALVAGTLFTVMAGSAALGNTVCPALLRRRPAGAIVAGASAAGALATGLLAGASGLAVVAATSVLFGLATGTALTAAYTAGGTRFPESDRGAGFGVLASASLTALAVSPVASGALAALHIRAVFVLDTVALGVLALLVWRSGRA
jgi:DHA1 family multidrug resistance protein-like MFS transporter